MIKEIREFSVEWLLKRAEQNLLELKSMPKNTEYYYTTIDGMIALEKRIEYMKKLIKEANNE